MRAVRIAFETVNFTGDRETPVRVLAREITTAELERGLSLPKVAEELADQFLSAINLANKPPDRS